VLRAAIVVAGLFVLLPYALVPFYRFINPVSTLMVWRWASGQRVERTFVPLAQISPALPLAVIMAEDGRYCSHRGIDFQELRGIVQDAEDLEDLRGGSTITQQTVKNLFLWPGRSVLRKILELPLALWTDLVLPKWRVMEIYLNIVEWGPDGQFGAEAASRFAFGKSARQLGSGEAALLAAILPNPRLRSARQPRSDVRRLAGIYTARAARAPWAGSCVRVRRGTSAADLKFLRHLLQVSGGTSFRASLPL
jgi:monofunctional biosynthetic peptidoglycan transglycosylase